MYAPYTTPYTGTCLATVEVPTEAVSSINHSYFLFNFASNAKRITVVVKALRSKKRPSSHHCALLTHPEVR